MRVSEAAGMLSGDPISTTSSLSWQGHRPRDGPVRPQGRADMLGRLVGCDPEGAAFVCGDDAEQQLGAGGVQRREAGSLTTMKVWRDNPVEVTVDATVWSRRGSWGGATWWTGRP
jgi:hypothetical protein